MTSQERTYIMREFKLNETDLNFGAKIIEALVKLREQTLLECKKLYDWIMIDESNRYNAVVAMIMTQGLTEKQAAGQCKEYFENGKHYRAVKWFFGLPAGLRERYKKFRPKHIDKLYADKFVNLTVFNEETKKYEETRVHFSELTIEEADRAFYPSGGNRPRKQQEDKMKSPPKSYTKVTGGRVQLGGGAYPFGTLIKKANMISTQETDPEENKKHVSILEDALRKAKDRGEWITTQSKKKK